MYCLNCVERTNILSLRKMELIQVRGNRFSQDEHAQHYYGYPYTNVIVKFLINGNSVDTTIVNAEVDLVDRRTT